MGFYNDTMQGGMRGPHPGGPMGPQGPMNMPPGQMGPQGPVMGGPGQMGPPGNMGGPQGPQMGGPQGPMNMPPNSMGHGPMPMGCPPNSMGPMGGPVMQGPMGGPMPQGQMGGPQMPMGQGPPIMNQQGMMGPQGPMGGPPRMNNPNLNPALAIVGALLRHVNPQMAPQVGQAIQGPRQNMGMLSPNSQGSDIQDLKTDFKGSSLDKMSNQDEAYSPRDDDMEDEPKPQIKKENINHGKEGEFGGFVDIIYYVCEFLAFPY